MPLYYHDWDQQFEDAAPDGEGRYTAGDLADRLEEVFESLVCYLETEKPGNVWFPPDGAVTKNGAAVKDLSEAHFILSDVMQTLRRNKTEIV